MKTITLISATNMKASDKVVATEVEMIGQNWDKA